MFFIVATPILLLFSCSVVSDSSYGLQHVRFPGSLPSPELAQTHVHQVSDAIQPLVLCQPLLLPPSIFRIETNRSVVPRLFSSEMPGIASSFILYLSRFGSDKGRVKAEDPRLVSSGAAAFQPWTGVIRWFFGRAFSFLFTLVFIWPWVCTAGAGAGARAVTSVWEEVGGTFPCRVWADPGSPA